MALRHRRRAFVNFLPALGEAFHGAISKFGCANVVQNGLNKMGSN